jgi:hypothetical protein
MPATYRLENWSVYSNPYSAPEVRIICLDGQREGARGSEYIRTSAVVKVEGRTVTTSSGTVYILGTIDPTYLEWMRSQGLEYDEAQPIKVKS